MLVYFLPGLNGSCNSARRPKATCKKTNKRPRLVECIGGWALPQKSAANLKTAILVFWTPHVKLDQLTLKMAFFCCFGASGRRRKCFKTAKLYFCTFATSPLAALACLVSPGILSGKPVQPVSWSLTCKNTILQFSNPSYAFQKPQRTKKEGNF